MPLIGTLFKRVAVDLIGAIPPPSVPEIVTHSPSLIMLLVTHDAVPLKSIKTETVAEALVDMYSRLYIRARRCFERPRHPIRLRVYARSVETTEYQATVN